MKIGFFDSGLGGLTVLKVAIENENLREEIVYLGDTKNTPYGVKDKEYVKEIIEDNIKYLVEQGCNPIVIACNTATSLCIKNLRNEYPDVCLIGTEPAVKVAVDSNSNKKILVLATSITVREEKLHNLIANLNAEDKVELEPADKLVTFAENINCREMSEEIEEYIASILEKYNLEEFSHIVLGCTHFPLFRENFKRVINNIDKKLNIEIVDGAKGISNNLINHLYQMKKDKKYISSKYSVTIVTTSKSESFEKRAEQILDHENIEFKYKLQ